jgi:hypothetical protein
MNHRPLGLIALLPLFGCVGSATLEESTDLEAMNALSADAPVLGRLTCVGAACDIAPYCLTTTSTSAAFNADGSCTGRPILCSGCSCSSASPKAACSEFTVSASPEHDALVVTGSRGAAKAEVQKRWLPSNFSL